MLEVHMAMMGSQFLSRTHVFFIVAQIVYEKVVLGVYVDWRTVPGQ